MIDFESKIRSLKLSWIKRAIINTSSSWTAIVDAFLGDIPFETIIRSRSKCEFYIQNIPTFYKDVNTIWNQINNFETNSYTEIVQESLWLNNSITVEHKSIIWTKWMEKGVIL